MANPSDVTIVNAVPFTLASTAFATIAENWGESAVTVNPQMISTRKNNRPVLKKMGNSKQQIPEANKEK